MQKRKLANLKVSAIGLGCMSMSFGYSPAGDKQEMISLRQCLKKNPGVFSGACASNKRTKRLI